jgi:hypothetical protein
MVTTTLSTMPANGQRRRPRIRLIIDPTAAGRFSADYLAAVGRSVAAAGFGIVHACEARGDTIHIARAFFAAGGELSLIVPYSLKDSEPLTWLAQELVMVDGEAAAASTALSLADALVMIAEDGADAHAPCRVPARDDRAAPDAPDGEMWAAARSGSGVQSVAGLVQDLHALLHRLHASPRDTAAARVSA